MSKPAKTPLEFDDVLLQGTVGELNTYIENSPRCLVVDWREEEGIIVDAVTDYVARRMIEREHALVATPMTETAAVEPPRRRGRFWPFAFGFVLGALVLFGLALLASLRNL